MLQSQTQSKVKGTENTLWVKVKAVLCQENGYRVQ
jgi:uncharacterized protein YacL (UPF0231 family)